MFLRLTSLALLFCCAGCVQEMANQPRVDVMEPYELMASSPRRSPPEGTIARGQNWEPTPVTTGRTADGLVTEIPVPVDAALLERGRQRFNVFCSHCHGASGYGDGMVVQRGFPAPPSYHIDRLREVTDGHLFVVVGDGLGRMPAFKARISPDDRWAIVSYIRALQLSQHAPAADLPEQDRQKIE